jgi:RNA polymerase sigma-70 factor (ECF subfamily)
LGQLQEDAAFSGWLFRTATNRCLNAIRARKPVDGGEAADELPAPGSAGRPERQAETSAQLSALGEALDKLTPEQRACWLLREVHGRSYDEIAGALGVTGATVRGRIARARAQLAEVMAPWR